MILNLTQHPATVEQRDAGVIDLPDAERQFLVEEITFDTIPTRVGIVERADRIAAIATASNAKTAMIGGAPWLMGPLELALTAAGVSFVYAFSVRESEEVVQPDGSVRKVSRFRHAGFIS